MSPATHPSDDVEIRAFRRDDRDQLTALVNAHVQAVVPGLCLSVNTVLSALERESGEFVVDPWVERRTTLVAQQRGRLVAAAHLQTFRTGLDVGPDYRGAGEIRWLLCWPDAPFWPDAERAGDALAAAAVTVLRRSGASPVRADGTLPAPGVYGVPDPWPHVHGLLERAGFVGGERTEVVWLADVARLPRTAPPTTGLRTVRTLGTNGTRLAAVLPDEEVVGFVEVDVRQGDSGRLARHEGWADVGNLHVVPHWRRRGVGRWLVGQAAAWLDLAHVDRLLDYCAADDPAAIAFLSGCGFRELTRTRRDWSLGRPEAPDATPLARPGPREGGDGRSSGGDRPSGSTR